MSWTSAFSGWGWADVIATFLVVVGVIGEVWAFYMKTPFNPTAFPRLESKKRAVEIWSLVILLVGVAIEVPATVENLKDAANARLESKTLEAKLRPRILQFDSSAFRDALNGKPKFDVRLLYSKDDADSYDLSFKIWSALQDVGWSASMPRPIVENDVPLIMKGTPWEPPLAWMMGAQNGNFSFLANNLDDKSKASPIHVLENAVSAAFGYGLFGSAGEVEMRDDRLPDNFVIMVIGGSYAGRNWGNGRKLK
jgi:hypothetical protein